MKTTPMTPTEELYLALQTAYNHFNQALFADKLPSILFTTQRQKGMMGCFFANRWASSTKGNKCHEIAINPLYVSKATLIELMQTLVHEMVHCWQYCYGKPSRSSYHNKEWANKMIAIGLMPSSTGRPGGKIVGQHMNDYPVPDGKFINECVNLLNEQKFNLPWVDRFARSQGELDAEIIKPNIQIETALVGVADNVVKQLTTGINALIKDKVVLTKVVNKNKVKYSCAGCGLNVWGKGGLSLRCEPCDILLDS